MTQDKGADIFANIIVGTFMTLFIFGIDIMIAQFVCFGLATYHIHSGLAGPMYLIDAVSAALGGGVYGGRRLSNKK